MSAVPPIASKFCAPQSKTPSAIALNRYAIVAVWARPEGIPREEIVGSERGALSEDRAVADLIEHGAPMVRHA
jgi:hypothetical protein